MIVLAITPAMIASGFFVSYKNKNKKTKPLSAAPLAIEIPKGALEALKQARDVEPPTTPPLLSPSASSTTSLDSPVESPEPISAAVAGADVRTRRISQEFYFPRQVKFESAAPEIVKAKDVHLKDHPIVKGAYAEYERLYNADSLMTKDGRHMVRLL
ncbi:hypothetical protein BGZ80_006484 [Entomortierella chlamydospora]|uniref:Uncharacterized protein n=1 Tax=Entomortierella chlamydospora TaxID=101097 RepID=A0A9P6N3P3_9FUNG|nr:hypothetical protein BGZ79_004484 [Entomortierella chlamydospora]KAG0024040.1 hypothetical protein BGZ80_006484 [Entomortierella chlamydospora]